MMEPKKQAEPRLEPSADAVARKEVADARRPVGMQAMGPALYEQLRRALHQMGSTPKR